MDFVFDNILELLGGIGAITIAVVAWLAKNYLVDFLKVGTRERYAKWLMYIADDATDDLLVKYPDSTILGLLDEAVDKIMEICKVDKMTARRVANASFARKKIKPKKGVKNA